MQESRSWPDPENPDKQDVGSVTQCWQTFLVTPVCQSFCSRGVCLSACWDTHTHPFPREQTTLRAEPPTWSSACWEIRTTSGRYASYWNAYLLEILPTRCRSMFSFAVECALIRVPMSGCTASTRFNFGHRCEYALDGNYGTDWATNAQGIGSWIKVFVQR